MASKCSPEFQTWSSLLQLYTTTQIHLGNQYHHLRQNGNSVLWMPVYIRTAKYPDGVLIFQFNENVALWNHPLKEALLSWELRETLVHYYKFLSFISYLATATVIALTSTGTWILLRTLLVACSGTSLTPRNRTSGATVSILIQIFRCMIHFKWNVESVRYRLTFIFFVFLHMEIQFFQQRWLKRSFSRNCLCIFVSNQWAVL